MRNITLSSVLIGAIMLIPLKVSAASLVWNPGPTYHAVLHQNNSAGSACEVRDISNMSEGHLDGNSAGSCAGQTCGGAPMEAPDQSCWSFKHVTYGWPASYYGTYPGWAVWRMSGGGGVNIVTRLYNHANGFSTTEDRCQLREVSQSYIHWPYPPKGPAFSFKQAYILDNFWEFHGKFAARLNNSTWTNACSYSPRAIASSDFGVQYLNTDGTAARTDIVGVVLYNPNNFDEDGNSNNNIYYRQGCDPPQPGGTCLTLLHGNKIGYNNYLTGAWQSYDIEFKTLVYQYLPDPPPGFINRGQATVFLNEVYSSVKGADVTIDVKDVDLVGQ